MRSKYSDLDMDFNIAELPNEKIVYEFIKRIIDIILCSIACFVAIPIILIFSILVILESEGNPIYVQDRLGKNGKLFKIYKIRSMHKDAEKSSGPKWADINDSRVTKVGGFIRKTRIDELPQLINVIKGEMSLVGPRPERPILTLLFEEETKGFVNRLQIRPGITGLAQVSGGYDLDYLNKLKFDLEYIEKRGLLLDIKIILKTLWIVLSGHGAR